MVMEQESVELNAAVEAIFETAFFPERWSDTLLLVSQCFDAEGALLFFQKSDGSYAAVNSPGLLDDVNARFISEGWNTRDVRAIRAQQGGTFGKKAVVTDQDLMTPEEIDTHPYYADFLAPHGLAWFMAASVSPNPEMFVVISVQRLRKKAIFGDCDRTKLELLSRHAERALRLSTRIIKAELTNVALGEALEHAGCGVALLNGAGNVVFRNSKGSCLVAADYAGGNSHSSPQGTRPHAALRDQIALVLQSPYGPELAGVKPVMIQDANGGMSGVAYVLPVAAAGQDVLTRFSADVCAIVLLVAQDSRGPVDPTIVRDVLGLTLGEARVASLVGYGQSPREAADALGITEDTARTVLKRVFAKTNVSKQSHLANLLTRLTLRR